MSTTTTKQPQPLEALERANRLRLARAAIKRQIAAGERDVAELLEPGDPIAPELARMTVAELLRTQHRWGVERARKLLVEVGITEGRQLADLTDRQRAAIVTELRGEHDYRYLTNALPLHAAA